MPEEIFVIIIVGIIAGTLSGITAQLFNYLKSRNEQKGSSTDASMTTSELEGMIQKWIASATSPLAERLENIEEKLEIESGNSRSRKSILDDMDTFEEPDDQELVTRRRTKS